MFSYEIIGDVPHNAILSFRAEDGTAVAVALKLNSVVFDTSESVAEFLVSPLDRITSLSPPGTAVELIGIDEVHQPIPQRKQRGAFPLTLISIEGSKSIKR